MRKNTGAALKPVRNRIWELDFLRGVCVLLMIFDHFMFDIGDIFGEEWAAVQGTDFFIGLYERALVYAESPLRLVTRDIVVWIFALLCGISCSFSRSNLKRGIEVAGDRQAGVGFKAGLVLHQAHTGAQRAAHQGQDGIAQIGNMFFHKSTLSGRDSRGNRA